MNSQCLLERPFSDFQKENSKQCYNQDMIFNTKFNNTIPEISNNFDYLLDIVSCIGILIFILMNINYKQKGSLIPRLLSVCWLIYGFKFYFDKLTYRFDYEDIITLISGMISISVAFLLYINIYDLLYVFSSSNLSFFARVKYFFSSLLFNYSYAVFELDKVDTIAKTNEIPENRKWLRFLNKSFYYLFISINNIPLIFNTLINKKISNLPFVLFPSPLSICGLTLFLIQFKGNVDYRYFMIMNAMCYSFMILNLFYEIFILKIFNHSHIYFILLEILNLILFYLLSNFFDIFGLNLVKAKAILDYSLVVQMHKGPEGGVQGFLGKLFKCDKLGLLSDVILTVGKFNNVVVDQNSQNVFLDSKHLRSIYPLNN